MTLFSKALADMETILIFFDVKLNLFFMNIFITDTLAWWPLLRSFIKSFYINLSAGKSEENCYKLNSLVNYVQITIFYSTFDLKKSPIAYRGLNCSSYIIQERKVWSYLTSSWSSLRLTRCREHVRLGGGAGERGEPEETSSASKSCRTSLVGGI